MAWNDCEVKISKVFLWLLQVHVECAKAYHAEPEDLKHNLHSSVVQFTAAMHTPLDEFKNKVVQVSGYLAGKNFLRHRMTSAPSHCANEEQILNHYTWTTHHECKALVEVTHMLWSLPGSVVTVTHHPLSIPHVLSLRRWRGVLGGCWTTGLGNIGRSTSG